MKERITVSVEGEVLQRLDAFSEAVGLSRSAVVEDAVAFTLREALEGRATSWLAKRHANAVSRLQELRETQT